MACGDPALCFVAGGDDFFTIIGGACLVLVGGALASSVGMVMVFFGGGASCAQTALVSAKHPLNAIRIWLSLAIAASK